MRQKHKKFMIRIGLLYPLFALILLPWTFYLSHTLPTQHINIHWNISWIGLDICLMIMLVATGIFAYRQSRWVIITATGLGSLLLVDAWFDILAQHGGDELRQAILLAIFVEIPIAVASFTLAAYTLARTKDHPRKLHPYMKLKTTKRRR